jgi:hypothetical protein
VRRLFRYDRVDRGPADDRGKPEVRLLDAHARGLDESALRIWAREQTAQSGAAHVTRSYSYPYAIVAWHPGPVGVDIERVQTCDAAFAHSICTPQELIDPVLIADPDCYFTALWSSKEALAKALGDPLRYDPRRLGAPMLWPGLVSGPWRAASLTAPTNYTAWVCWREPGRAARARETVGSPAE